MNVSIVFEISEEFEDPIVNSVWDTEEKAITRVETLSKESILAYYEGYPVLDCEPRTTPHEYTVTYKYDVDEEDNV